MPQLGFCVKCRAWLASGVAFSVEANLKIQNILHGKGGQAFQGNGSGVTTNAFAQLGNLYRLGFVCFSLIDTISGTAAAVETLVRAVPGSVVVSWRKSQGSGVLGSGRGWLLKGTKSKHRLLFGLWTQRCAADTRSAA